MGIRAPSDAEKTAVVVSSLVSYNRPVYLILTFVLALAISYLFSKKNIKLSFVVAISATVLEALYFIISSILAVRF